MAQCMHLRFFFISVVANVGMRAYEASTLTEFKASYSPPPKLYIDSYVYTMPFYTLAYNKRCGFHVLVCDNINIIEYHIDDC